MIRFLDVSKSYKRKRVLTGASHTIKPGRLTLLVGANGVGKSTLLRLIAGVECPDSGLVEVCGLADPARNSAARAALAYLPQTPQFHPRFTCLQLASFYARLRGTPSSRALAEIEYVGLGDECHTPSGELSGGMRQRLGIAILLASRSPVLLLDEPALSLDQVWREQLIQRLRKEADDGATVLVTSHLLTEWKDTSDDVIECKDGRIETSLSAMPRPTGPTGPTARPIRDIAGALFMRELRSAFVNRHLQVFAALALVAGGSAAVFGATVEAVSSLALQGSLYFAPSFALLLGVSSALAEFEEWPILLSQPFPHGWLALAKFASGALLLSASLLLFLLPPVFHGIPAGGMAEVFVAGISLLSVFLALGLCCGFWLRDRARALVASALCWLAFYLAFDAAALALAHLPTARAYPDAWTALLMLNPVDAFRIHALFTLEGMAPEEAAKSNLSSWWIANSGLWLVLVCSAWIALLLASVHRRLRLPS